MFRVQREMTMCLEEDRGTDVQRPGMQMVVALGLAGPVEPLRILLIQYCKSARASAMKRGLRSKGQRPPVDK